MFKLIQSQKLLQKLSPQQIQLMKMLQLPTVALEQRIKEELELNPALEEGIDEESSVNEDEIVADNTDEGDLHRDDFSISDYMNEDEGASYKTRISNTGPDDEKKEIPFSVGTSFQERLSSQLGLRDLNNHDYQIADYLIGNLDDDGYLRRDLSAIADDIAFSQNINTCLLYTSPSPRDPE